jgi:hypothetical protein
MEEEGEGEDLVRPRLEVSLMAFCISHNYEAREILARLGVYLVLL